MAVGSPVTAAVMEVNGTDRSRSTRLAWCVARAARLRSKHMGSGAEPTRDRRVGVLTQRV